jgi:nitrite reductase (NADH) small subunit
MNIIELDLDRYDLLSIGERNYFVLNTHDGKQTLVSDRCPHRGGPLHLGNWDWTGNGIVCPWHQTCVSVRALIRRAPAAVRERRRLTVVTEGGGDQVLRKRCFARTLLSTWMQLGIMLVSTLMGGA